MFWGRGIYKEYRENSSEISRGDGQTVSNGKKKKKERFCFDEENVDNFAKQYWKTEENEHWATVFPKPLLPHPSLHWGQPLEIRCSQIDVTPFVSDESAVGSGQRRTGRVVWLEPTLNLTEKPIAECPHRDMLWVILLSILNASFCDARAPPAATWTLKALQSEESPWPDPPPHPPGESLTSGIPELLVECSNIPFFRYTILKGVPRIAHFSFLFSHWGFLKSLFRSTFCICFRYSLRVHGNPKEHWLAAEGGFRISGMGFVHLFGRWESHE